MTARSPASEMVRLLRHVAAGTLEASVNGATLARLDGDRRNLSIQVGPFLSEQSKASSVLHEAHLRLWEVRGVPSALAKGGWHVSLVEGPTELVGIGRDASALTGHVRVGAAALWKLRRLF